LAVVLGAIAVAPAVAVANQARDVSTAPVAGTAVVAGVVTTDETQPAPVRRARVTLTDSTGRQGATTITDDAGAFVFTSMPAGRFVLAARKESFVPAVHGSARPGGTGVPIVVTADQRVEGLVLRMVRGGVITGTLRDVRGNPASSITVTAERAGFQDGRPALIPVPGVRPSVTDDRGMYRIWGLPPGEYFVSTDARYTVVDSPVRPTTAADIQRALQMTTVRPGTSTSNVGQPPVPEPAAANYAPTFFPGTASREDAARIRVGPGEERTGIDFPLLLVPTFQVAGTIVDPAGGRVEDVGFWIRRARPYVGEDDLRIGPAAPRAFSAVRLVPGDYVLHAEARVVSAEQSVASLPGPRPARTHWARLNVTVDHGDQMDLVMTLRPYLTVSGRVEFDGEGASPKPGGLEIRMREADETVFFRVPTARTDDTGNFQLPGVIPTRWRIQPPAVPGWTLKSIRHGGAQAGQDLADVPLEVADEESVSDLVLTYTARVTELAGRLQDDVGRPTSAFFVVVFTADRAMWTPQSRRIQSVRPATDGQFVVRNLPAGDYYLAALTDIDDGQWFDPDVLASLIPAAMRLTLAEGERRRQDIRIGR
jgi:hypothetical protein